MDEARLGPEEGPLQRARLHMRSGKRRLRQGKISAGIVTLYDALSAALQWYVASPARKSALTINAQDNLKDERAIYAVLVRSGILDGAFDYEAFDRVVEAALRDEMPEYDYTESLRGIESVMTQLGVMPFDEKDLPAEDPATF
ncbi:MAG: hypothetical protein ABSA46_09790 [Thermodesulfovibrionales bacterium]|jgi:hypothetical protein